MDSSTGSRIDRKLAASNLNSMRLPARRMHVHPTLRQKLTSIAKILQCKSLITYSDASRGRAGPAIIPAVRACGGLECGRLADLLVIPAVGPRGDATKKDPIAITEHDRIR
jgi:hypothetical protein